MLTSSSDIHKTLKLLLDSTLQIDPFDSGEIYIVDERTGTFDLVARRGFTPEFVKHVSYHSADALQNKLVIAEKPIYICYSQIPPSEQKTVWQQEGLQVLATLPLKYGTEVIGAFNLASHISDHIPSNTLIVIETIVSQIGGFIARVRSEERLKEEIELSNQYLNVSGNMMVVLDSDQKVTLVNRKGCEMLGYGRDEIIGRNWFDNFIPENIRQRTRDMFDKLMTGVIDPVEYFENPVLVKDGDKREIAWRNSVLRDQNGTIIGTLSSGEDITERLQARQAIERKLTIEQSVASITSMFIAPASIDTTLDDAICMLGELCGSSRAYLFKLREEENVMDNTHEWCAEGVQPHKEDLQNLPVDMFPWWITKLRNNDIIHLTDVSSLPPEASAEKKILEMQEIKSLIVLPLYVGSKLTGFVGLDNVENTGNWKDDDISILRLASEIMGMAIERRQKDVEVEESEKKFKEMADQLPQSLCEYDLDGNILFANRQALDSFNYTQFDLDRGQNILHMLVPKDRDRVKKSLNTIINGERAEALDSEYTALSKDGNMFPILVYTNLIFHENRPVGFRSVVVDITNHKRMHKELKESEERLSLVIEGTNQGLWDWDLLTDHVIFNKQWAQMIGYRLDEIEPHINLLKKLLHPDDVLQMKTVLEKHLAGGTPYYESEYRLLTKSGEWKWVLDKGKVVKWDEQGNPVRMAGTHTDISQRKQAEENLEKAYEELKTLDTMKNEFLANISHELRTPLVSIKGFSELLNEERLGKIDENQKKATDAIIRNSERLNHLIDSLLYMSRRQARKIVYNFVPVQITTILDLLILDIVPQINKTGLMIKKDIPVDIPLVNGDKERMEQVFLHLLDNAIKFTPLGGTITISVRDEKKGVHIMIKDTGVGIAEDKVQKVFQNFYQIDGSTTRKYDGTGIGLPLCKRIVDDHGGKIQVESKNSVGTTVHVWLPELG
ncbi:MAG: PAS domain S-box protein [Euryarchaeota archaeon]|nr:PAS domain S-box protein [Euryarchaeota archaeon]